MISNLHIALRAAIDGGIEIMKVYATDFDVEIKGDNSPLTIADKNANEVINEYLVQTGIPIISEENKQISYDERKDWSECWIVDPLDGTKEFVKRNGEFTVNIALVREGRPVLGVIYVPVEQMLYFSSEGEARKIKLNNTSASVENIVAASSLLEPAAAMEAPVKVVGSRSHLNDDTRSFIEKIEEKSTVEIVSRGSSLKFCLVAEGNAHIYPRYAPTMEWDTAAGQAICEGAGVKVLQEATGEPMRYNKENLLNPYFLVTI